MSLNVLTVLLVCGAVGFTTASDVLGCGGFIKSHVPIDFSKVMVKLYTKQGILKDETNCAPNNGYYFIPIYDKGEYNLQLEPPLGWTFDPTKVNLVIDGNTDLCSQGKDINFVFKGFGIAGKVESVGSDVGPADVTVELKSAKSDIRTTTTTSGGLFFFALVYPGDYVITISHPRWKILKNTINLKVSEGDTQLPQKSLIIGGFDVNGVIKSDSTQLGGVNVILYTDNKNTDGILVDSCVKTPLGPVTTSKYICHVTADSSSGKFKFPAVSAGRYTVLPHYTGKKVYFRPESLEFTVTDDSVKLDTAFEIVGFSISGKVFDTVHGNPLRNAQVSLNGELVATTDGAGSYTLDKIKTGNYEILVSYDNVQFSPLTLSLTPATVALPDVAPSTYRVCGTVASDVSQTVGITKVGSTNHYTVTSEPGSGVFCEYLPPASYHVEVTGTKQGVQFYPRVQKIEVTSRPISDISFTQLKATLDGKVECITRKDCSDIKVILKSLDDPNDQDVIESIKDSGSYTFTEIRPGNYHVTLTSNRLCWNYPQFVPITVTSFQYTVPTIKQTGYTVYFQTSHDTSVTYKPPTTTTVGEVTGTTLAITRTTNASPTGNTACLPLSGSYTFHVDTSSCHTFDRNTLTYNTDSTANRLTVTAVRHRVNALIGAGEDYGLVRVVSTSSGGGAKEGVASQVKYDAKLGGYQLIYDLAVGESVNVKAESESLCFTPSEGVQLEGGEDCKDLATVIVSRRGHVFTGRILPPLAGVSVQLLTTVDSSVRFTVVTDDGGSYRFPPVEQSDAVTCHVHAELDSYVFGGPDERGDFHVHKLAEVLVQVVDIVDNLPLQGALLSMSGGDSYRRNLQTNDDGKVSFQSLSPSDYFLRPMMKEYSFEPSSKMIPVKEGVTVNVRLMGRRVAYSAFGRVTSLNGEPEGDVIVIASGAADGNCSQLSEETSTESSGLFRIRGLVPFCTYNLRVHTAGDDVTIERSVPEKITAKILTEDISQLHLVTLHSSPSTDLLLRLYIPPHSPTAPPPSQPLTVRVSRMATSTPPTATTTSATSSGGASTILHSTRVVPDGGALTQAIGAPPFLPAPGMLVHLPSVPQDGKLYKVELESSVSLGGQTVNYFTANSSFKYVEMELVVVERTGDQQVKVTSVFTLVFIVVCMVAAYNIDRVTDFAREHLDGVLSAGKRATDRVTSAATSSGGGGGGSQQKSTINEYAIDTSEIDQIVQSINATKAPRKVKSKRI